MTRTVLIRISGPDQPGITAGLLRILANAEAAVLDMEQFVVRGRLTLDLLVGLDESHEAFKELLFFGWERGIHIDFESLEETSPAVAAPRHAVTVLGHELTPVSLGGVADAIAGAGGNIDRIIRLSHEPVICFELVVSGADHDKLRRGLATAAADHGIDVAMQREGLERRAKRLVVLDVDSTLIQDEMIDLLAAEAGVAAEVERLTSAAMEGDLDFASALVDRVRLLVGLDEPAMERALSKVRLTDGADRFVRTLQRLGYTVALVSGGFTAFSDRLAARFGIEHSYANELVVQDGKLTGEVERTIVDREAKADLLRMVARMEGIPVEQTVAVGDGANDIDMLSAAGLGIAFNARAAVRHVADTTVSVPYLDAVLFLLGISGDDL